MSATDTQWLVFDDPDDYARVRNVLTGAGYTASRIRDVLNLAGESIPTTGHPLLLRSTQGGSPLETLIRLFIACVPVEVNAAREALAPMTLERWQSAGLLHAADGKISSTVKLLPVDQFYVVHDIHRSGVKNASDFVVGIGNATMLTASFMIRRPVGLALDMGTGNGILAFLKSASSQKVFAVDRNPRAISMARFNAQMNGLANVECLEGDLFEPVHGLKFDLIVSNAPFVISPSSGYLYLDGGHQGEQFIRRFVREAADHLTDAGYCQFMCNWAHFKDQDWEERLAAWFKDTACDVWVLRGETQDARAYAHTWISHFQGEGTPEFQKLYTEWTDYYERERIEAVSLGFVTMRRKRGARPWFRVDIKPEEKSGDLGEDVIRIFQLGDFLNRVHDDAELMKCVLQPAPELRLDIQYQPDPDGWQAQARRLRIERGLVFTASTDELGCQFIIKCDGVRTVASVLSEISEISGIGMDKLSPASCQLIRHLIGRGFLLPAELLGAHSSDSV